MAYAQIDDFKLWIGDSSNTNDDLYDAALEAGAAKVDHICKRTFEHDTETSDRTYRGLSMVELFVDDFDPAVAITVATDVDDDGTFEVTWSESDYELGPANFGPYYLITAVGSNAFPIYGKRSGIKVTAKWGWPGGAPEAVREANMILARDYVFSRDAKWGIVQDPEAFGSPFRIRDNATAQNLLLPYRRIGGWA